jgi:PPOX class probable F420-dependent enzyme
METIPDSFRDLLTANFATLATVGKWGGPHQSIVWFLAEGDVVRLSLNSTRLKTDNLARNPNCSLLITDPENSYRYLELRGRAELEPDPDYVFADKVGAKYGSDLRQNDNPGDKRVVATIVVDRARGYPSND